MSREWNAVPCVNATPAQVKRGHHLTRNDNRICDRCRRLSPPLACAKGGDGTAPVAPQPLITRASIQALARVHRRIT